MVEMKVDIGPIIRCTNTPELGFQISAKKPPSIQDQSFLQSGRSFLESLAHPITHTDDAIHIEQPSNRLKKSTIKHTPNKNDERDIQRTSYTSAKRAQLYTELVNAGKDRRTALKTISEDGRLRIIKESILANTTFLNENPNHINANEYIKSIASLEQEREFLRNTISPDYRAANDRIKKIREEVRIRDEISYKFLTEQRIAKVSSEKYGELASKAFIMEPSKERDNGKKMLLQGGWGVDPTSFQSEIEEAVYQGFTVLVITTPDTQYGQLTKQFVNAVREHAGRNKPSFEPHAEYLIAVTDKLMTEKYGADWKIDVAQGQSMGAAYLAQMALDEHFASHIDHLVFNAAASTATRKFSEVSKGFTDEAKKLADNWQTAPYYTSTWIRRDVLFPQEGKTLTIKQRMQYVKHYKMCTDVWGAVLRAACKTSDAYAKKTFNTGKNIFFTGANDEAAAKAEYIEKLIPNIRRYDLNGSDTLHANTSDIKTLQQAATTQDKLLLINNKKGFHGSMIARPEESMEFIMAVLGIDRLDAQAPNR